MLPVHEELFSGGLYVTHVGWERVLPGETYPKQDHHPLFYHYSWEEGRVLPEFCMAVVMAGKGESQTKSRHKVLGEGSVFLIAPGEWHRHRPCAETGWDLMWIHFNGGRPGEWLAKGAFGANHNYPAIEHADLFLEEFKRLVTKAHADPTRNSLQLSWQAVGLLSHFVVDEEAGGHAARKSTTGDAVVDAAIEHIWNFSHGMLDVPGVVEAVGTGRRSLERRFRAVTGHGVLEEIQHCRFTRAAWLLVETDLPVKTIVGRAGFNSHEQMRLVFHKRTGGSPEVYRESGGERK
ncbi:helix-turn-helix domain-containing protein [Luteolibacter ambystomatis]|uniref:Helix-turn-helix domain-containing protein n=1 Tax=Luteolibacter ambystomatis TaxID=2824561 RepID=A0A975J2C0_9BACT|nr:AraC family transcriptional regulator [Luteolibacter ambystomatis]QUE52697.1 helix-turn-helix domain-containing protein [Luteolibacter ambystomatis]